jgi:drug/metabolite transporter (DMT)-like permease
MHLITWSPGRPVAMSPSLRVALPYLALGIGVLSLSMAGIFLKWANAPAPVASFYRTAIASIVVALPFALQAKQRAPFAPRDLWYAVLAGLFFAGDLVLFATAVLVIPAANASLFATTAPFWVGIGSMVLFKERLPSLFWGGLLLAFCGVFTIIGQDFLTHPVLGAADLLALSAGCFYGLFFLATDQARRGLPSLITWWIAVTATAFASLVLCLVFQLPLTGYSLSAYLDFLGLALLTQVCGWIALNYAIGHLRASIVAATLQLQPVVTAIIAVPLLGQPVTLTQIGGGALVLIGIFIVHRSKTKG